MKVNFCVILLLPSIIKCNKIKYHNTIINVDLVLLMVKIFIVFKYNHNYITKNSVCCEIDNLSLKLTVHTIPQQKLSRRNFIPLTPTPILNRIVNKANM